MRSGVHPRQLFVFISLASPHFLFCFQSLQIIPNLLLIFLVTSYSPISQFQFLKIFLSLFSLLFFFFLSKTRSSTRSEIFLFGLWNFLHSYYSTTLAKSLMLKSRTVMSMQIKARNIFSFILSIYVKTNWICPVNQ